jgi:outer membrane lipoprotein-sorting protein
VLVAGVAWSGDDARAVIDNAIKAMGGAKNLAKFKAMTFSEKGTYYGMGEGLPYTGKYALQWPNQFRMEIAGVFTTVLNGDKGWVKSPKETREMTEQERKVYQVERRAGWVSSLVPLQDPEFALSKLSDGDVEGKPAAGVLVTRKGYPKVKLYFDKKSGLPVKTSYRVQAPEKEFKETTQEIYYSNYQPVDGVKMAHKLVVKRDGKLFVEAEVMDIHAKGKLANSVFAQP